MNMEDLVEAFLNIRAERERIQKAYEAADAELKSDQKQIEVLMLNACNDINANSINTAHGTIIRKLDERYFCSDWEHFYGFVRDLGMVELFEKRIHQKNLKAYLEEHQGDGLPPGVNVMREYGITVRKSSNKDN